MLISRDTILVKICKWLKLLNSVPFFKKTLVNHVYIRIWSSWLTFTVLLWMKKNPKISQFSGFLMRSEYAIQVKIGKWLKLLNSVLFIKKTLVNHVYIRILSSWLTFTVLQWMKTNFKFSGFLILSSWLTFTVLQWMKTNFKLSQFSRFLLSSEYAIHLKIWKWLKFLNYVPFNRKTHVNQVYILIWSFWLSQFYSEWRKTPKLVNFQVFCDLEQYMIMTKTS